MLSDFQSFAQIRYWSPNGVPTGGLPPRNDEASDPLITDTRSVSARPEFGKEARGYRIILDVENGIQKDDLPALVEFLQDWAVNKYKQIDFGGSVSIDDKGRCIIQGEFAPNRFKDFTPDSFSQMIEALSGELKSKYEHISGGIRDYSDVLPSEIEAVVGIEPGYKGTGAVSFEEASRIIANNVDGVQSCNSGIVFYSYESDGIPNLYSEPVVVFKGTTKDVGASFTQIALQLKQTSVHAVAGYSTGPAIHHAYKVKGELTAREAAQASNVSVKPFITKEQLLTNLETLAESDRVKRAIELVSGVEWEPRIGGGPALEEHIYAVTNEVYQNAKILGWSDAQCEEAIVTAILHDYIEDIDRDDGFDTIRSLFGDSDLEFGEKIANNVLLLSHNDEKDLTGYFNRLEQNAACAIIKVSDRHCNLLTAGSLSEKSQADYLSETARFILPIARSFGSSQVAQKIEQHLLPAHIAENTRYATGLPFVAAAVNGGVTFEIAPNGFAGSWTFTSASNDSSVGTQEQIIPTNRMAVYIPTIQKNGIPVEAEVIEGLIRDAELAGFTNLSSAVGAWVLGHDSDIPVEMRGTIQSESIWILSGSNINSDTALAFAKRVVEICNQDSVAVELSGQLVFLDNSTDLSTISPPSVTKEVSVERSTTTELPYEGPRKLVVIPLNDGEAYVARDYLLRQPGVDVVTSKQPWGASWEPTSFSSGLEDTCIHQIREWQEKNPDGLIYGYELAGENSFNAFNLNGNTTEEPSTFTLIASVLSSDPGQDGMKLLNNYERLIAAHTAAGFGPLNDELLNQGIDPESPYGKGVVVFIAKLNRACLGITPSEEAQAIRDIHESMRIDEKVIVHYSTQSWVPQADALFVDSTVREHIHIPHPEKTDTTDLEQRVVYYGHQVDKFIKLMTDLNIPGSRWWYKEPVGNSGGYFGMADTTLKEQQELRKCFLAL